MLRVGDLVERINGANGDIPEGTQAKILEIDDKDIKNIQKYIPNDFDYTYESAKKLKEDILENKDY